MIHKFGYTATYIRHVCKCVAHPYVYVISRFGPQDTGYGERVCVCVCFHHFLSLHEHRRVQEKKTCRRHHPSYQGYCKLITTVLPVDTQLELNEASHNTPKQTLSFYCEVGQGECASLCVCVALVD